MFFASRSFLGALAFVALLPLAAPAAADVSARLSVSPRSHSGDCPHKFTFNGTIRSDRRGRVQYKFIRSDGANAPVQTLNFDGPGVKRVSTSWTLGANDSPRFRNFQGWQAIEIVYPQQATSNRAAFTLRCGRQGGGGTVRPRPLPDLVVRNIRLVDGCKIEVLLGNVGGGRLPESAYHPSNGAAVQMWRNGRPWGGQRLAGIDPQKRLQRPGGTVRAVWFPDAANLRLPRGPSRLKVTVDNNNAVRESNEDNNSRTQAVRCGGGGGGGGGGGAGPTRARPDLGMYGFLKIGKRRREVKWSETITLTPADVTRFSGGRPVFEIYYSYREYQDVRAPGPFKNKVFFGGRVVSQQTNLSLGPKEIKSVHTQAYLNPVNGPLSIRIDADNEVSETRENNNGPFTVNLRFRGF